MERRGALEGLPVLDLTDETGRLTGALLALAGDLIRLRRGTLEAHGELAGMSVEEIAAAIGEELFG
jgi:hypothetical protein